MFQENCLDEETTPEAQKNKPTLSTTAGVLTKRTSVRAGDWIRNLRLQEPQQTHHPNLQSSSMMLSLPSWRMMMNDGSAQGTSCFLGS